MALFDLFLFLSLVSTSFCYALCYCGFTNDSSTFPIVDDVRGIVSSRFQVTSHGCGATGLDLKPVHNVFGDYVVYSSKDRDCPYACKLHDVYIDCFKPLQFLPFTNHFPVYQKPEFGDAMAVYDAIATVAQPADVVKEGHQVSGRDIQFWKKYGYDPHCDFFDEAIGYQKVMDSYIFSTDDGCLLTKHGIMAHRTGKIVVNGTNFGLYSVGSFAPSYNLKGLLHIDDNWSYILDIGLVPIGANLLNISGARSYVSGELDFDYVIKSRDGLYVTGLSVYNGTYIQYVNRITDQVDVYPNGFYPGATEKVSSNYIYVNDPVCGEHVYNAHTVDRGFEIPGKVCPYDDANYTMVYDFFNDRPSHIVRFPPSPFYDEVVVHDTDLVTGLDKYNPCLFDVDNPSSYGCQPKVVVGELQWHCERLCVPLSYTTCKYNDSLEIRILTPLTDGNFYLDYNLGDVKYHVYFLGNESCPIVDQNMKVHPDFLNNFGYYKDNTVVGTFDVDDYGKVIKGDGCQIFEGIITCNHLVRALELLGGTTDTTYIATTTTVIPTTDSSVINHSNICLTFLSIVLGYVAPHLFVF